MLSNYPKQGQKQNSRSDRFRTIGPAKVYRGKTTLDNLNVPTDRRIFPKSQLEVIATFFMKIPIGLIKLNDKFAAVCKFQFDFLC